MKHSLPTFATIAVLAALVARSGQAPVSVLVAAVTALCLFAGSARARAMLAVGHARGAEPAVRVATIAMLVFSCVVLFCCATAIGRSGHLDLVAAVPVVLALFGAMVRDARVPVASSAARMVPWVPLCGFLLLAVAWIVDGRLGFDRRMETAHAAAMRSASR